MFKHVVWEFCCIGVVDRGQLRSESDSSPIPQANYGSIAGAFLFWYGNNPVFSGLEEEIWVDLNLCYLYFSLVASSLKQKASSLPWFFLCKQNWLVRFCFYKKTYCTLTRGFNLILSPKIPCLLWHWLFVEDLLNLFSVSVCSCGEQAIFSAKFVSSKSLWKSVWYGQ